MKIRALFTSCLAVALLAILPAAHAAEKMIKFNLRNDTGAPLELKAGADQVLTLPAGATKTYKLPVGTSIVTNKATESHKEGDVLVKVSENLNSSTTIVVKK